MHQSKANGEVTLRAVEDADLPILYEHQRHPETVRMSAFLLEITARPLFGYTAEHNIASQRVLEKCGFVRAGESKGVLNVNGVLVTEVFFRLD